VNPRTAARQYARQASALARAEVFADAAETIVQQAWRAVLDAIAFAHPVVGHIATAKVHNALTDFPDQLIHFITGALFHTADWSHATAIGVVTAELRAVQEGKADMIPAPDPALVRQIVYRSGWSERLRAQTALGHPSRIAEKISRGIQAGKTHQEIAEDLLPIFDGIRSTANASCFAMVLMNSSDVRTALL